MLQNASPDEETCLSQLTGTKGTSRGVQTPHRSHLRCSREVLGGFTVGLALGIFAHSPPLVIMATLTCWPARDLGDADALMVFVSCLLLKEGRTFALMALYVRVFCSDEERMVDRLGLGWGGKAAREVGPNKGRAAAARARKEAFLREGLVVRILLSQEVA